MQLYMQINLTTMQRTSILQQPPRKKSRPSTSTSSPVPVPIPATASSKPRRTCYQRANPNFGRRRAPSQPEPTTDTSTYSNTAVRVQGDDDMGIDGLSDLDQYEELEDPPGTPFSALDNDAGETSGTSEPFVIIIGTEGPGLGVPDPARDTLEIPSADVDKEDTLDEDAEEMEDRTMESLSKEDRDKRRRLIVAKIQELLNFGCKQTAKTLQQYAPPLVDWD
ncbi:hypothetical protein BGX24_003670, partial [Mortierella sp. AD032]